MVSFDRSWWKGPAPWWGGLLVVAVTLLFWIFS
jgi:hypothetical protein